MTVIKLKREGLHRVLKGSEGMTFPVDNFTRSLRGPVAHVRDYRFSREFKPFQVWSIPPDGYEVVGG
jgi:hypothetical protein